MALQAFGCMAVDRHSDDAVSKWRLDGGNIALLHLDPLEYGE
jgi:hypothetical protein